MDQVLSVRAEVGAKINRLNLTQKKLDSQVLSTKSLISYNEDIDLAEVSIKLKTEENVYRASLAVGARIIQPSLVDFLR
jgi:flagellar hook-associated protein 3 FlgL